MNTYHTDYLTPTDIGGTASVDEELVQQGDVVTVTATPNSGYKIEQIIWWDDNNSPKIITDTKAFTVGNSQPKVQVTFRQEPTMSLGIKKYETDGVTVFEDVALTANGSASGVSGTASLDKKFAPVGETVKVTVNPKTGYKLKKIEVQNEKTREITDITSTKSFTVEQVNYSVWVYFQKEPTVNLAILKYEKDGTTFSTDVALTTNGSADGVSGTASVDKTNVQPGDTVKVTATPKIGYLLKSIEVADGISGDRTDITNKKTFKVGTSDPYVFVSFKKDPMDYTITLNEGANGHAEVSATTANAGDKITVTATPDEGYVLDNITWKTEGGTETSCLGTKSFTMPHANVTVKVTFRVKTYQVKFSYKTYDNDGTTEVSESGGTASVAAVPGLDICGKTGTAQNPHGNDHSVFICFAPRDNPKIAVAAYVENGGFGATWAAPIASLLTEKYLNGEISKDRKSLEERMLKGNLMDRVKVK